MRDPLLIKVSEAVKNIYTSTHTILAPSTIDTINMNDIVANTLSAYTSALHAAARATNALENSSPLIVHEHVPLSEVVLKDESLNISPTIKRRGRVSPVPHMRLPLKKALSVHWKDQSNRENASHTEAPDEEMRKGERDVEMREDNNTINTRTKKRSPSPPHLDIKEYECRMKKLKMSIGDACKLELKYLNRAKQVRDKRTRMVEKLKHMKRKAQRFTVLNAQRDHNNSNHSSSSTAMDAVVSMRTSDRNEISDDDDFVLPPVFPEKASKQKLSSSNFIDMTQQ